MEGIAANLAAMPLQPRFGNPEAISDFPRGFAVYDRMAFCPLMTESSFLYLIDTALQRGRLDKAALQNFR